jgi:hypothetical protein
MNALVKIWSKDQKDAKAEALAVKAQVFEARTNVAALEAKGDVSQAERNLTRAIVLLAGEAEPNISVLIKLKQSVATATDRLTAIEGLQSDLFGKG